MIERLVKDSKSQLSTISDSIACLFNLVSTQRATCQGFRNTVLKAHFETLEKASAFGMQDHNDNNNSQ